MRGADAGGPEMIRALLAFWKGILYDRDSRAWAWDAVRRWSLERPARAHARAGREGLRAATPDGRTLGELAGDAPRRGAAGLCRQHCCGERGEDERIWLAPLAERVAAGRTPADDALDAFGAAGTGRSRRTCAAPESGWRAAESLWVARVG